MLTRSSRYVTIHAVGSHCCRMLHENEKNGIKDILKLMPEEEVHMLAQTVTSNMIITTTVEGKRNVLRKYFCGCVNLQNMLSTEQTTGSRVHRKKLTVPQLGKKFPAFYGTARLVACSQESLLHVSAQSQNNPFYVQVFQVVYFCQVSPLKLCVHISTFPFMPHVLPISFFLI